MAYTSFANLTIGTVAGVKSKLGSPSLALQLTQAATLSYAVLSVVGNTITTQQPHGLATNDTIQFTGTALPSPLVAGVTYYAIFVSSVAFQASLTSGGSAITLTTTGTLPIQVQNLSSVDDAIQAVLDETKVNVIAKHLDAHFRDIMPDTIQRWIDERMAWWHSYHRRPNLDTTPLFGMFFDGGTNGLWYLTSSGFNPQPDDLGIITRPATYFVHGTPTNSPATDATLLSVAWNGDRLYDTLHNVLYVNRGSQTTSPVTVTWNVQTYEDVKDYLINPDILQAAHCYAACFRMFELGLSRLVPNYQDSARREYFMEREAYYKNKCISELYGEGDDQGRRLHAGVLKLLQHDYSNSGTFNEFSREITPEDVWVS